MTPWQRRGLALASGVLLYFSFPNVLALGFEAWPGWLAWVALLPLLTALENSSAREGASLGFITGLACFVPGLAWLTHVRPLGPGAWPAWLALAAWSAAFAALFGAVAAEGLRRRWAVPVLWIAALWTLTEALREHLLSGFPWMGLGSSQYRNPALLPLAAALGQGGLHFAVALGNAILFGALRRPSWLLGWKRSLSAIAAALCLVGLAQWQGAVQRHWQSGPGTTPLLRCAVIQGAIDLDQPWNQTYRSHLLSTYFLLSQQAVDAGATLLLWPESAFPGFFNEDAVEAEAVKAFARTRKVTLLIGSTLSENNTYTNSAVWVEANGNTRSYSKRHLVPFGEFVPFRRWAPLLDLALAKAGVVDFSPGTQPEQFELGAVRVKPLICFESVFPDMARSGGPADLLALLTVDTWYGRTAGPVWHASQSVIRAVEEGTWLARCASTGISFFAAPDGRLLEPLGLDLPGYRVQAIGAGRITPFQRFGAWPLLFACVVLLLGAIGARKKS